MSGHADTIRGLLSHIAAPTIVEREQALAALDALVAELQQQADRIVWLEGDVAGWRIKNQQLRDALDKTRDTLDEALHFLRVSDMAGVADRLLTELDGTPSAAQTLEEQE